MIRQPFTGRESRAVRRGLERRRASVVSALSDLCDDIHRLEASIAERDSEDLAGPLGDLREAIPIVQNAIHHECVLPVQCDSKEQERVFLSHFADMYALADRFRAWVERLSTLYGKTTVH